MGVGLAPQVPQNSSQVRARQAQRQGRPCVEPVFMAGPSPGSPEPQSLRTVQHLELPCGFLQGVQLLKETPSHQRWSRQSEASLGVWAGGF